MMAEHQYFSAPCLRGISPLQSAAMFRRFLLPMIFAVTPSLFAGIEDAGTKATQSLYVQHLVTRLHDGQTWTKDDAAAVQSHFNRLKEAAERGQVIFAGRTKESGDKTFGLVIFEAAEETAASQFMNADPAITAGVMTAELHPFSVVLQRKNP
jgi:uncharacterized protein